MTDEHTLLEARPAPEGWVLQSHPQTFSGHAGPFYFREEGGPPGVGFFSEPHHANLARIVHGGALMTLADMSLFDIFFRANGRVPALTMTMNAEFLSPAPLDEFITATGEVMKAGRTTAFVRGVVSAKEKPVLSFSGVLKRLS
jgi:acyl-coenzyme A thioesterase 13